MGQEQRISWIDTARGIGLLLVFIGHLRMPWASAWVYTFHMPLFFFLSGLLYPGFEKYSFAQFAWRRFKSLVIPYFTLGAVIALFYCGVYASQHEPASVYVDMLHSFLVQEHFWTIWFLAALYLTQLIYYGIDKFFHRWRYGVAIVSLAVCVFGLLRYRLGWGSLPWNLDVALVAQIFFHLGYWFMNSLRIRNWFVNLTPRYEIYGIALLCLMINLVASKSCLLLSGHSLNMSIGMYGNEALSFIGALAGIMMVVVISPVIHSKFITYLGRNTMILFSWHSRIVIVACDMVYAYFGVFQAPGIGLSFLRALTSLAIILVVLIPVNELIKRWPYHKAFGV